VDKAGWFYLDDPNGRERVARWKERPGMLGLRFYFNERHKREWMTDGSLDWLWPAAERAGAPVALAAALFLPRAPAPLLRGVRRGSHVLGHRHHADAPFLATMRDGVTEELPWLKDRDLELVMGEALCNWVGWRLPG
jgi:hypothetical protein